MKLLRLTFACTLLLLAASPSFALQCDTCTEPYELQGCEATPGSGTRCWFMPDWCETRSSSCTGFSDHSTSMLAEWTVASIEISRPATETKVVTAPAAVADAGTAQNDLQR